jgi:hypothetical protein
MIRYILTALNIDSIPRRLLIYLFVLSAALGVFQAFLFVTALAEFLAYHDLSFYPQVLMFSGAVGFILFGLYRYIFRQFRAKVAFLVLFALLTAAIAVFGYLPHLTSFSRTVVLLILWLPFATVSEHVLYRTVENFESVKEQQNLRRFLEFSVICGTVLGGTVLTVFAANSLRIPFTTASLISLGVAIGAFIMISRRVTFSAENKDNHAATFVSLIKTPNVKGLAVWLVLFVILSISTFVFIDYSFLVSLDKVYTSEIPFTQFLGFFLSVTMVVNLFFKLFVYRNLLKTFSIYKVLQFSPLALAILLLGTFGWTFIRGEVALFNPQSVAFMSVVLCRFFSFILRESFEFYSIKLFFTAMETYLDRLISKFLRVSLILLAFVLSGFLLLLTEWFFQPAPRVLILINAFVALVWLGVSFFLSRSYTSFLSKIKNKLTNDRSRTPLKQPDFYNVVFSRIGFEIIENEYTSRESVQDMILEFQKPETWIQTQIDILKKINNSDSEIVRPFLIENLDFSNKWIVGEIARILQPQKHTFSETESVQINKAIHYTTGLAAWLLAMDVSIRGMNVPTRMLKQAIREEYETTLIQIFDLLRLIYSEGLVDLAREHSLADASNEQREFSLEMLGKTLDAEIQACLLPLLHNNRKREKVSQLSLLYPIDIKEHVDALREIVNADLGTISLWTKACALNALAIKTDEAYTEDIYAQLFNPELILAEIGNMKLQSSNYKEVKELLNRLPRTLRHRLQLTSTDSKNANLHSIFQKVHFLKGLPAFRKIKGHDLIPLAEAITYRDFENNTKEMSYRNGLDVSVFIAGDSLTISLLSGKKQDLAYGALIILPIGRELVVKGKSVYYFDNDALKRALMQNNQICEAMHQFLDQAVFLK